MSEETENKEDTEKEQSADGENDSSGASSFMFKGSIEIFPYEELPNLYQSGLKTCRAKSKKGEDLFAVFCDKTLFPRVESVLKYNSLKSIHTARLIASGVSDLSKKTKSILPEQVYIFVFENIFGQPILGDGEKPRMALKPELVRQAILPALVAVLHDFNDSDLMHGSLHAGNVYLPIGVNGLNSGDGIKSVYVGECLSLPFSYSMPSLYLPIGVSCVPPIARGRSTFENEIYALGVLLAVLLRKTDPCEGFSEREIIKSKIEHGSYQSIVGDNRIDVFFLNALRGMLQDDPAQRWTLQDVYGWVEGHRVTPKHGGMKRLNANRPLKFNNESYLRPELLSFDFPANIDKAYTLITGGELEKWIDRSVANPALKAHLKVSMDSAAKYGQKTGYVERTVAQTALMLNNNCPVFYKDVMFLPDGFGSSFAHAAFAGEDLSVYAEIIGINLIGFWLENQSSNAVDAVVLMSSLEACKMSLKQQGVGYGIERCPYILCSDAPCISPAFSDYYIKTPDDYFYALNDMCLNKTVPSQILDRHVAAFLSVRDSEMIDAHIMDINSSVPHVRAMAVVKILATIQRRSGIGNVKGISGWIVDSLSESLLARLHDRQERVKVSRQLRKIAGTGDVVSIAALFEEKSKLREDQNAYIRAMNVYQELLDREETLKFNVEHNKRYGQGRGREVASVVSITISFLIVVVSLIMSFGGKVVGG